VGRLVYQKAHETLISAMPSVLKEFPETKLDICGDGYMRSKLELQIQSLHLSKNVRLLGRRNDVDRFLAAADIFVLPSRWEGLPIALLEAMSMGLPVIATNVQGVDEVIMKQEYGLLVPVEDADRLAAAILQLLRNPQLRKEMGIAGRKRLVDVYSIDRMAERYLSLILAEMDRKN
jgi:glycosyltransferase involved in cell wall biosynthesis